MVNINIKIKSVWRIPQCLGVSVLSVLKKRKDTIPKAFGYTNLFFAKLKTREQLDTEATEALWHRVYGQTPALETMWFFWPQCLGVSVTLC